MNDMNVSSASEMMDFVMNLTPLAGKELPSIWKRVVSKIGKKEDSEDDEICIGERQAGNSKVIDLKNGVLLVEANHSGWIQYLKMYQKFILKGLKWNLPDLTINTLAFRVAGSSAKLNDTYEQCLKKSQSEMQAKIEQQEIELEKLSKNKFKSDDNTNTLPPELLAKFENIKNELNRNVDQH